MSENQPINIIDGFVSQKLTDWKQEPRADQLMTDFKNAVSDHSSQMSKIEEWLKLLNTKTDKTKIKKGRSGVAPKVIRRLAEWRYSSLSMPFLNERNVFKINATAPAHINAAFQNELILNNQFNNQINKVKFINEYIRTAVNEGTVIVRVGWDNQTQIKEKEVPIYNYVRATPEEGEMLLSFTNQMAQEQEQMGLEYIDETPTYSSLAPSIQESFRKSKESGFFVLAQDTGKIQIQKEEVIIKNQPDVQVIDNNSLIIDPTCNGDFSKARFAVYVYQTSLSELIQQGEYELDRLKSDFGFNIPGGGR